MFKIALINMPFGAVDLPSLALTQLSSVLTSSPDGRVKSEIYYLNHDFARYFGIENYTLVSESVNASVTGLGDWLFRSAAFPDLDDNTEEYFRRHSWQFKPVDDVIKSLDEKRRGLDRFLDELIEQYKLHEHTLIGFTSMFAQNVASFALARKLKQHNENITITMGGANCEAPMGPVIARNVEVIDFVFSGPALKTFPQFVQHLVAGEVEKCHEINGVFSKKKMAGPSRVKANEIGEELDIEVDVPLDYEGFFASLGSRLPGTAPTLLFETSRGCWWGERSHCTFCGLNGITMKYRAMSSKKALDQFEGLFKYYPRVSRFKSVDNILPRQYLTTVLPRVKPPGNVSIFYELKADLKDHEMQVLASAGVKEIQPGIEALATSTLKLMKKGTTSFHNLGFLKNCLVHAIRPVWNLLIGFPGEREEVYIKYVEDLPLLVHFPPPTGVYPVRFDRFSPYFTLATDYGLKLQAYDFYAMIYPFPPGEVENLAYFFADHNFKNSYITSSAKWLKPLQEATSNWQNLWRPHDGKLKPSLGFRWRGETRVVSDTRSGLRVEHEIELAGFKVLEILAQPMKFSKVVEKAGDIPESELKHHIESLQKLGLIFADNDRFMSLVVDNGRDQGCL